MESVREAVFLHEFLDITRRLPKNFDLNIVAKNINGFVTIDMLTSTLGQLSEWDFMICGPPLMMSTLKKQLHDAGVSKDKIHTEEFSI
jgi:ferredoxin-NADP reductase